MNNESGRITLRDRWRALRQRLRGDRRDARTALNDLDSKLDRYLDFREGFFIEAGANDGYSQSNTFYLEKKRGWRGVLVEGIPALYKKCKLERRNSTVLNCALVAADFPDATVTMQYAHLMSVVDGALKDKDRQSQHLKAGVEVQHLSGSYSVTVPARTLESILDHIPALPAIDFLSLDVEGYELNVLRGLNLEKYRPRYILVEANFFDEINALLVSADYEMIEKMSFHDYLYRDSRAANLRSKS